jgi:glycosidase
MLYDVGDDEALFKMAVILQFTFPGLPMIYYGDELGLEHGAKELSNRTAMGWESIDVHRKYTRGYKVAPMEWEKLDRYNSFHEFYVHMIWVRAHYPVLTEGRFLPLYADETAVAYARVADEAVALVIANRGEDRVLRLAIPEALRRPGGRLKCEHGSNDSLELDRADLDFPVSARNSYLFFTV